MRDTTGINRKDDDIGLRIRATRKQQGMSVRTVAGLAGMSAGHWSNIENGNRRIDRRSTLEAMADALNVSPSDLAGTPFPPSDRASAEVRAAAGLVEGAVADIRLGDAVEVMPREWHTIAADLTRLQTELRPRADYAAQGVLLSSLIPELHAVYASDTGHRTDALRALTATYHAAAMVAKSSGLRGIAQLAADRQLTVAERLGGPQWIGHAEWVRAQTIGGGGRDRQARLAERALSTLSGETMTPEVTQSVGQLHLSAALAYAASGHEDTAWRHFEEAARLADGLATEVGQWGYMWFGLANVRIWRVALAVELGWRGKVAEVARDARPEALPSPARQAEFYADLGRALATEKRTRTEAVRLLRKAEDLAPQRIRTMPLVRETVADLVTRSLPARVSREVRGMAHRFGIAA